MDGFLLQSCGFPRDFHIALAISAVMWAGGAWSDVSPTSWDGSPYGTAHGFGNPQEIAAGWALWKPLRNIRKRLVGGLG